MVADVETTLLASSGGSHIGPSMVVDGDRYRVRNGRIGSPFGHNEFGLLPGVLPGGDSGSSGFGLGRCGHDCHEAEGEEEGRLHDGSAVVSAT